MSFLRIFSQRESLYCFSLAFARKNSSPEEAMDYGSLNTYLIFMFLRIYWFEFPFRNLWEYRACQMSAMEQQTEPTEEEKKALEVLQLPT